MLQRSRFADLGASSVRRGLSNALDALAIAAACWVYYLHVWPSYAAFNHGVDARSAELYCDFSRYYYKQARALLTGDLPMRGYYYSPTLALLLAPSRGCRSPMRGEYGVGCKRSVSGCPSSPALARCASSRVGFTRSAWRSRSRRIRSCATGAGANSTACSWRAPCSR